MAPTNPIQAIKDLIVREADALQTWHQDHRARDLIVAITVVSIEYLRYFRDYMHYLYQLLRKKLETRFGQTDVIRQWYLQPRHLDLITVYTLLCCENDGQTWLYTDQQASHLRKCITETYLVGPGNRKMDNWDKLQAKEFEQIMKYLVEADMSNHLNYYCRWKASCGAWHYVRTEFQAAEASGCTLTKRELGVKLKQKYDELVGPTPDKAIMSLSACAVWQLALGIHQEFNGLANSHT